MEPTEPAHFIRVEKGSPDAEELAALTALVLALAAADADQGSDSAPNEQRTAGWRRLDRQSGFRGPRTWHENPPATGN
ncbi:acyl-CoA carboxylase epsilon subunit [Streptomyces sp. NPDC051219]|uniref:acyl-CoA carboxylase epsilon subunit n=1 Tax=Streptomyces sp. NPDC051219 TaxID=3155283 RepID=UPI003433527A